MVALIIFRVSRCYALSRLHILIQASHYLLYVVVHLRMCKNEQFSEGSLILIIALLRNHSDNSFMFQIISHSRNDIKLRRGNYL